MGNWPCLFQINFLQKCIKNRWFLYHLGTIKAQTKFITDAFQRKSLCSCEFVTSHADSLYDVITSGLSVVVLSFPLFTYKEKTRNKTVVSCVVLPNFPSSDIMFIPHKFKWRKNWMQVDQLLRYFRPPENLSNSSAAVRLLSWHFS